MVAPRSNFAADQAVSALRRVVALRQGDRTQWSVLLLEAADGRRLAEVARQVQLPSISAYDETLLGTLLSSGTAAVRDASLVGVRRLLTSAKDRQTGREAAAYLSDYQRWATDTGLPALLDRATRQPPPAPDVPIAEALAQWVGLGQRIEDLGSERALLRSSTVAGLSRAISAIDSALKTEKALRANAHAAGEVVRKREVRVLLAEMPVDRLREATRDRLRTGSLAAAGLTTVQAVLDRSGQLEHLPGIGATTAVRTLGAARTLWQTTYDEMPVRLDLKKRTPEATELLRRLAAWDAVRRAAQAADGLALKATLSPLAGALTDKTSHLIVFSAARSHRDFVPAVKAVVDLAAKVSLVSRAHRLRTRGSILSSGPRTTSRYSPSWACLSRTNRRSTAICQTPLSKP